MSIAIEDERFRSLGSPLLYCGYLGEELFALSAAGSGRGSEELWGAGL
ncbi:hypothetical protein KJ813_01330 [bacterium]|nr:hypothetical protein [bacterium]